MKKRWMWLLLCNSSCFALPYPTLFQDISVDNTHTFIPSILTAQENEDSNKATIESIKILLQQQASTLSPEAIQSILSTLECAQKNHAEHNNILTVIDYSLPSNEKRLWVFDILQKKLLFHTYVSHGLKTGLNISNYFSNKYNSRASSIGVYKTEESYYGRHGLSLQLNGLDSGFNDNAGNRAVVLHGGWYVNEDFIQKYGRAGRSWGCPAVPEPLTNAIIKTIKNNSLFVVYYPSERWLLHSKFLNCKTFNIAHHLGHFLEDLTIPPKETEQRADILYADLHHSNHGEDSNPIITLSAEEYMDFFHQKAPLERMLRRQINNKEYIALSIPEFNQIISANNMVTPQSTLLLHNISFVVPEIKMVRGYYATEMKIVHLGTIKEVSIDTKNPLHYIVHFEANPSISLKINSHFIRWLGL